MPWWGFSLACVFFLAQAVNDPIGGSTGWVGAGLLGLVLGWLTLKYIPAKDQQLVDLIDKFSTRIQSLYDKMDASQSQQRIDFRAELAEERKSRMDQHQANVVNVVAALERLGEHLDRLRDEVAQLSLNQQQQPTNTYRGQRDTEIDR